MEINNFIKQSFKSLIQYKTVSGFNEKEFKSCAYYLIDLLKKIGFNVRILNENKKPIILAQIKKKSKPKFIFLIYGHYDVQDTGKNEHWKYNPYSLSIDNGKFFGRGTCDSKGNILANLITIKKFLDEKKNNLDFEIRYLIEGEEEIGSPTLINLIKKNNQHLISFLEDVNLCMFPGESSVKDNDENIIIPTGYKGCLYLKIKFFNKDNKSIHSSFGKISNNPAYFLLKFINKFKDNFDELKFNEIKKNHKPLSNLEKKLIKILPYKFNSKLLNFSLKKKLFLEPSCNIIDFQTANSFIDKKIITSIPYKASIILDIRLTPNLTTEIILNLLKKNINDFFKKHSLNNLDYDIKELVKLEYGYSKFKKKLLEKIKNSFIKSGVPSNKIYFLPLAPGSGPQYYLCTQFNTPTFVAGVGYFQSNIHSINENIRIKDFFLHINFLENLLISF